MQAAKSLGRRQVTGGGFRLRLGPLVVSARRHARRATTVLVLLAVLTASTVLAGAGRAGAAPAELVQFSLSGRGYGHGVGMSQWGAYGYAKHGWKYRDILSHYYTGITFGTAANETIRVLLAEEQTSVRLSAVKPITARAGSARKSLPAGAPVTVSFSGGRYMVSAAGISRSFALPVSFSCRGGLLKLANVNQNGWSSSANVHYRGALQVRRSGSGVMVVNALSLEDYVRGVVPREVSAAWPAEAVKAQAVAARSFGAQRIGSPGPFDVYCTTRSQCYNGADGEAPGSDAATAATRGVVPLYEGKPIIAAFFSSSGGHTESSENVWSGSAIPYLRGVDDPYDTYSPNHIWPDNPIRRSGAALATALGSYSPSGNLLTVFVTKRGVSPRIVTAYAISSSGTRQLSGPVLRMRLGLRDSWLDIRSMSIRQPASAVASGSELVLRGRTFPALPDGAKLMLKVKQGSRTSTAVVPAAALAPVSLALPGGGHATGTQYTVIVRPTKTASYSFTYRTGRSPAVTVTVRAGSASPSPSPSPPASPSPSPSPTSS